MDDLISRQAAIDALKHNRDVYSHNFHDDPIDKYTTAIIATDIDTLVNLPTIQPEHKVRFADEDHVWIDGKQYISLRRFQEAVKEASHEPQWIPIERELPRDGSWNIFTDGKNISVERYKADAIDHFFPPGRWFQLEDVIAWMPLPTPYTK